MTTVDHDAAEHLLRATLTGPLERAGVALEPFSVPIALSGLAEIAGTLSDGERQLYHAALSLWNSYGELGDLIRWLDVPSFRALLEALVILRPDTAPAAPDLTTDDRLVLIETIDLALRITDTLADSGI